MDTLRVCRRGGFVARKLATSPLFSWKVVNFLSSTVKPRDILGAYNYITFITVKPTVIRYRKELYMKDVLEVITLVFSIVGLVRISDAISEIFDRKIKK